MTWSKPGVQNMISDATPRAMRMEANSNQNMSSRPGFNANSTAIATELQKTIWFPTTSEHTNVSGTDPMHAKVGGGGGDGMGSVWSLEGGGAHI